MNDFWENISRYPRFFISSLAGSVLVILTPVNNLLKVPRLRIGLLIGLFLLLFVLYTVIVEMTGF